MKTNWQHQKDAITTDQKFRDDDEHIHELDKRHLKQSKENRERIPNKRAAEERPGDADQGED
jgi:hypothetical protein